MEAKTDIPGLYKSSEGYLINKDNEALRAYKMKKAKDLKIDFMEKEMSALREDMNEIKQLLRGLVK